MRISEALREKFETANRVCVLTGAGISAESGVPTFRGGGSAAVWKNMPFDQISSARMVRENLPEVWEWFDYRRGALQDCQPNAAHFALAAWQNRFPDFTLVTQNIDGLHAAAGSRGVIELHGNIQRAYCPSCLKRFDIRGKIPHAPDDCDACGAMLRPTWSCSAKCCPPALLKKPKRRRENAICFLSSELRRWFTRQRVWRKSQNARAHFSSRSIRKKRR
jgi:NAD-dependent deacetylase